MPIVNPSSYRPPPLFRNGHAQTIFPSQCRHIHGVLYQRLRITTPDDDFLDLDYSMIGASRLVVITHGLEGNSQRAYVLGMVRAMNRRGWDALAWNFRACGGEINRKERLYHSGDTADLETVVQHVLDSNRYEQLALVGFSMGGNITLKYLGEHGQAVSEVIRAAVAFSVPCDLYSGAIKMARASNTLYMNRFLLGLGKKIRIKAHMFPGRFEIKDYHRIRTFKEFDGRYTAPLHGFASAEDYYEKASCKPWLPRIAIPTLLVNAEDDPFLAPPCYPREEARQSPCFHFEAPAHGGHVGFVTSNSNGEYWSETRAAGFIETHSGEDECRQSVLQETTSSRM